MSTGSRIGLLPRVMWIPPSESVNKVNPVCCSVCVQYNTRKRKTVNALEHLLREWRLVDRRWTWGRGSHSNNVRSDSHDSGGSKDCQYLSSQIRISLYRLLHSSWLMGTPPYIYLLSTKRHLRDRSSLVFCALALPCIMLNEIRRTKNGRPAVSTCGEILKRDWFLCVVYYSRSVLLQFATLNFRSVSSQF